MPYNKAIPAAGDRLKDSQPQLLQNFATISALLGVDHVISPWTDPATEGQGKHNKVTMPEQAVAPAAGPTTAADEMALYTKQENSVSQLFVRREGDGTEINLTNDVGKAVEGWTRLPNGLIVKWGYVVVTPATARDALIPVHAYPTDAAIPVFTTVYTVLIGSTQMINNVYGGSYYQESRLAAYTVADIQIYCSGLANSGGTATDWTYISVGI
jgi:hypothetical protein